MRQYIGARYVPLVMGQWDKDQRYEPLSIVFYLNSSYTSITSVPAGILPTNKDYWALTGDYSGYLQLINENSSQIKISQDNITTINSNIDKINTDINTIDEDIGKINNDINTIDEDIGKINNSIKAINDQINKRHLFFFDSTILYNYFIENEECIKIGSSSIINGGILNLWNDYQNKDSIDKIFIVEGKPEVGINVTTLNNFITAVNKPITFIFVDDVWHNIDVRQSYVEVFNVMESIESYNWQFINLCGYLHSPIYYENNGNPGGAYYQAMRFPLSNYVYASGGWSQKFNLNNSNKYAYVDNHIITINNEGYNFPAQEWNNQNNIDYTKFELLNPCKNWFSCLAVWSQGDNNGLCNLWFDQSGAHFSVLTGSITPNISLFIHINSITGSMHYI